MLPWQRARGRPLVAFSAGPYATALADGSEYDGSYADRVTEEQLLDFHRQRLQATDPDSHCCLTLQSKQSKQGKEEEEHDHDTFLHFHRHS